MAIDAVEAGKDVYLEKPMAHTIEEGFRNIQAVRPPACGCRSLAAPQLRSLHRGQKIVDTGALRRSAHVNTCG